MIPTKVTSLENFLVSEKRVPKIDSQDQHQRLYTPYEGYCANCGAYAIGNKRESHIFCSSCGRTAKLL